MSGAKHTPGLLQHDKRGYPHADVRSVSGRKVATTWGHAQPKSAAAYERRTEEDRENARRIVACWNACVTFTNEQLEEVPTFTAYGAVLRDRDALLRAAQGLVAANAADGGAKGGFLNRPATREHQRGVMLAWQALHAAIAKATGSAS